MSEEWRPVVGFEGRYEVSNKGRVRSLGRTETYSRILNDGKRSDVTRTKATRTISGGIGAHGYLTVRLKGKTFTVHRLVLSAFIGPCQRGLAACHNDGNKLNNAVPNLRWDTYQANNADRAKHGTWPRRTDQQGAAA